MCLNMPLVKRVEECIKFWKNGTFKRLKGTSDQTTGAAKQVILYLLDRANKWVFNAGLPPSEWDAQTKLCYLLIYVFYIYQIYIYIKL
jgi:hypothetical protein